MSHDTDTDTNATPDLGERIQRLRQALRHPKILAADGWYTPEDDRIAPTDREYIAACEPATISALLSDLDELRRIVGAYRPQKELADALKKSKSSRVDAVNRLKAEHTQRITMQHHAADQAQCIADLRRDRDELAAANAALHEQVNDWHRKAVETRAERDALAARLAQIEAQEPFGMVEAVKWDGFGDASPDVWIKLTCGWDVVKLPIGAKIYTRPTPAAAPAQEKTEQITLNAAQLRHALEFVAPDFDADPDQRESEVTIAWRDAGVVADDDGNPEPAGYVAWITDYPEEGALPLSESWDVMPAAAPAQASGRRVAVDAGALQMVINALRRDADDGRTVRGEMADALLAAAPELAEPAAIPCRCGPDGCSDRVA